MWYNECKHPENKNRNLTVIPITRKEVSPMKKMIRRILSMGLALTLLLCLAAVPAAGAESTESAAKEAVERFTAIYGEPGKLDSEQDPDNDMDTLNSRAVLVGGKDAFGVDLMVTIRTDAKTVVYWDLELTEENFDKAALCLEESAPSNIMGIYRNGELAEMAIHFTGGTGDFSYQGMTAKVQEFRKELFGSGSSSSSSPAGNPVSDSISSGIMNANTGAKDSDKSTGNNGDGTGDSTPAGTVLPVGEFTLGGDSALREFSGIAWGQSRDDLVKRFGEKTFLTNEKLENNEDHAYMSAIKTVNGEALIYMFEFDHEQLYQIMIVVNKEKVAPYLEEFTALYGPSFTTSFAHVLLGEPVEDQTGDCSAWVVGDTMIGVSTEGLGITYSHIK